MVATPVTRLLFAAASGCSWLLEPSSSSNSCRPSGVPAEFSNAFIDSGFTGAGGVCDGWAPSMTSRHMLADQPYAQRISSSTLMRSRATIMPAHLVPPSCCMSAAFGASPLPCTSLAYLSNGSSFTSPPFAFLLQREKVVVACRSPQFIAGDAQLLCATE